MQTYTAGFALLRENVFIGNKPHELTICVEHHVALGDIRRKFAVSSAKEAQQKCAELKVRFQFRNF